MTERMTVQINLRLPPELLDQLDLLVEDLNKSRGYPKLTRSDVIRSLVNWAIKERPDWIGK